MSIKMDRTHHGGLGEVKNPYREGTRRDSSVTKGIGAFDRAVEKIGIENLLRELDEVGSKLSRVPSTVLLGRYRELMSQLLKEALKGLKLRRDLHWRRSERRALLTVEKTETLFEELEEVIFRENCRTRSLELMEDIKGCLISLLF